MSKLIESLSMANRWFLIKDNGIEIELNKVNGILRNDKGVAVWNNNDFTITEKKLISKTIIKPSK